MAARSAAPLAALALFASAAGALAADDGYVVPSFVRLHATGSMEALIDEAFASDWDVTGRGEGFIEVLMPQNEARSLLRMQRARGATSGPLTPGSQLRRIDVVADDADDELRAFGADAGVYHTYAEALAVIDAKVASHPQLIRREVIGTTEEGRQIVACEITAPGDAADRPSALVTGLHHAREWISVEVPVALIEALVDGYGEDPQLTQILDTRRVWVVPVVNPDGHDYSINRKRMWRKNRAQASWGATGVDPNRNYGYKWGGVGSSGSPWSQTYRGPEAFSEPETRAIRDLALREGFAASLSFHSYSQLVLWPWGYTYDDAPDAAVLKQHGEAMGALTGYRPMSSSGLYRTTGDFTDWFYGQTGALSYTFELGTQFVPPEAEVPGIVAKNLAATRYFLEHVVEASLNR